MTPKILIIDLGSQYALVIARRLRELSYRSAVLNPEAAEKWLLENRPKAIILSGGDKSVTDADAPVVPEEVFALGVPILGICYGMQLMAHKFGGVVTSAQKHKEYGNTRSNFLVQTESSRLFSGLTSGQEVFMSHGDSVEAMPSGFECIASSIDNRTIHGMSDNTRGLWGVQFHPEVDDTSCGAQLLRNFLSPISACVQDWKPENLVETIAERTIKELHGRRAIIGFSGGVDSTTLARVLASRLGNQLQAICIDAGQLRSGEIEEIIQNAKHAGVWLRVVRVRNRFCGALAGTTDAETKRKIFKRLYRKILLEESKRLKIEVIIQGTLATDIIESGAVGGAALIKSHHNVGGFPGMEQIHPFQNLFKYEVREIARALGLPPEVCERKPSPGPGLFLRVLGKPVTLSRLALLRWADKKIAEVLEANNWTSNYSQLVVALMCVNAVGVKGDARSYGPCVVVRAVKTLDFMTAKGVYFPEEILRQLTEAVTAHPGICRLLVDSIDKPPGTIEFE